MTLLADLWRNLLWCGMIGAAIALVASIVNVMRGAPVPGSSPAMDAASGTLVGIVMGVVLLGTPACVWSVARWLFVSPKSVQPVAPPTAAGAGSLAHDASHGAMVGSTAAIPGAIAGGAGGFLIVLAFVGFVAFVSLMTGSPWLNQIMNGALAVWFAGVTIAGAVLGALTGMVLGGTIGAIFGGVRSATRH